jgi:hypothetical protein
LLAKDVNGVPQFCQPHVLLVDVLSMSLGALCGCLSSHDGLLLRPKPLYLPLDPDQLVLLYLGFIFFYFIPILDIDLVEFGFILVDLQWQRWVCVEVLVSFASLAGACCGGGHVGLLRLSFYNIVDGWVLYNFGDGGDGLSGWLLE